MTRFRERLAYSGNPNRKAALAAIIALVALLLTWWYVMHWYEARLLGEERAEAIAETSLRGNTLSLAINRRLARLQDLSAFVRVELLAKDLDVRFETFAEGLYASAEGIRYLAVAPAGVVRYVYPQQGNESLLAHDMLQDPRPQVQADTHRSIKARHAVATGPVELIDGGLGLIARQPIYQEDAFWGLVFLVLDVPTLLQDAGLGEGTGEFDFALRDSEGQVFFDPALIIDKNPVLVRVQLSEETWELASVPVSGWGNAARGTLLIFEAGGLAIVFLLTGLIYLSVNRQSRLAEAVRRRTREISIISEQYRSIFESTSDGLLIFDLQGHLVDFNPAAHRIYGYSQADFRDIAPADLFHPDSISLFDRFLEKVKANRKFHGRAVNLRWDGVPIHIEIDGIRFVYRGQAHALAVIRDVTEEMQAYQLLEQRVQQRTHELATLLDVSASIASTLELRPLLELVLDQLGKVVDYSAASILLLEGDELRDIAHRGSISGKDVSPLTLGEKGEKRLWAEMPGNALLILDDVRQDNRLAQVVRRALESHPDPEMAHVRAWMGIPFPIQEQLRGWLLLYHHQPGVYTSHHAALVQTIANQVATAVENAYLFAQTRRLAALEERQRLARELHDSVSQVLYSIGLAGHTALAWLEQDPGQSVESMRYVLSLADAGLTEMRALIFELRPGSLEKDGLVVALTRQAAALRARHELEVETELCKDLDLPFKVQEALYRIAREALNNVIKHAQASRVVIRLQDSRRAAVLEVQDDGVGFDPGREYPGQMGLNSMRERAAELDGDLVIESLPSKGTHLVVRIPH